MTLAIKLSCTLLLPGFVIGLLVGYNALSQKEQDFRRYFDSIKVVESGGRKLQTNSFIILQVDQGKMLLHSSVAQRLMMQIDLRTLDTMSFIVPDGELKQIKFEDPRVVMSENILVIADASTHVMLRSTDARSGIFTKNEIPQFSLIIPASDTTFVFRTYSSLAQQDILSWIDISNGEQGYGKSILEKQVDGVFCVDGILLFNKSLRRIVYVYYYRNEFITADAQLKHVARGHTVDQTHLASIQVDTYERNGERTTTFKSPPRFVNNRCATDGNYLYVVSNVRAKNQEREAFDNNYTVDRYNLITMNYEGSFYLVPTKNRHKLKNFDFAVSGDLLMAIYDEDVVLYRFLINSPNPLFEQDPK